MFNRVYDAKNMAWGWAWDPIYTSGKLTGSYYTNLVDTNPTAFAPYAGIDLTQTPEIKVGQFGGTIDLDQIWGASAWAENVYSLDFDAATAGGAIAIKPGTVKLTSNATGLADYYNVGVVAGTPQSLGFTVVPSSPLTVIVPSTLSFECYDQYGKKVMVQVPVNIVP